MPLAPISKSKFEQLFFKVSEISKIIDFIRETGKLQASLTRNPVMYKGLDYLEPFFKNLRPPTLFGASPDLFWDKKEVSKAIATFNTLTRVSFLDVLDKITKHHGLTTSRHIFRGCQEIYVILKLGRYAIAEEIENLIVDNPEMAYNLLGIYQMFITNPFINLRFDLQNFTFEETRLIQNLLPLYQPEEMELPCEIGKFLLRKLTYAAQDMRACYDIIDNYGEYDLQKVQSSLNKGITTNHPDIVNKSSEELSEILDNIWNDKTIPKRIKNIEIGIPVSIAAIGYIVGGLSGLFAGGFLAELGYKIAEKATDSFFSVRGEQLSERIAKLRTRSYQANVYGFKKKYKHRIRQE